MLSVGFADNIKPFSIAVDKYMQAGRILFFSEVLVCKSNVSCLAYIVLLFTCLWLFFFSFLSFFPL